MSDLSLPPLNLALADTVPGDLDHAAPRDRPSWPVPPFAAYGGAPRLSGSEPCEIEGMTGATTRGRLTAFEPERGIAKLQVVAGRAPMPLRFEQFRSLTLTTLLKPATPAPNDPHATMLAHRPQIEYRLQLAGGGMRNGLTVGHVQTAEGLYLYIPAGAGGAVQRQFVPRHFYREVEFGPRIGDVLVQAAAVTPAQVEQAVADQAQLRTQRLGEILLTRQIVSPDQLVAAIDQQARMPMMRIGEALMGLGMITPDQLIDALEQQKFDRSTPLGQLLVRRGLVSPGDLQMALARKMGYPVVDVAAFPVEADAVRRIPFPVADRLGVVPLLMRDGRLIVAMEDPTTRSSIEELEFVGQCKMVPVLASSSQIARALLPAYEKFGLDTSGRRTSLQPQNAIDYEPEDANQLLASLEQQQSSSEREDEAAIEQSDNSLVRLVNTMIIDAYAQKVSDIHIETQPGREKLRIRFRRDGVLKPYLDLPHTYRAALIARIKIMCDLDISERRKPQDGKINFSRFSPQHRLELRVATIPTNNNLEDVVMRLLASAKPLPLDQLGMSPANLNNLDDAIKRPYGMVLCVGPTGSGKTTTLHSALSRINTPDRKIWTAEDPVEITQAGLRQVQVNPKIEWTFAKALRAFLRADPDVIMVGEIRDGETARMAVEASLTGHLVLSTLHTNSAPETVTRLLDMGMDPFNFADSLLAVLAQRLVRRLCVKCRTERDATEAEIQELLDDYLHVYSDDIRPARDAVRADWTARHGRNGRLKVHHAPGCDHCDHTGFRGRVGVHELLMVSRELRRLITTGGRVEQMQHVGLRDGMHTLRQDGIDKVLQGLTTIEEVRATSNV